MHDSLEHYRAIVAELDYRAGQPVVLDSRMCEALRVTEGSTVRVIAL